MSKILGLVFALMSVVPAWGQTDFSHRMVWANLSPQGMSLHAHYGELYPIDMTRAYKPGEEQTRMKDAQNEGIDGFWVVANDKVQTNDSYFRDADAIGNFYIAPLIDLAHFTHQGLSQDEIASKVVDFITAFMSIEQGHPSAYQEQGKYVITLFGSTEISPQAWQEIRQQLNTANLPVFLIHDLNLHLHKHKVFPKKTLDAYAPSFDAAYTNENSTSMAKFFNDIVVDLGQINQPYAGGIWPGYDREVIQSTLLAQNPKAIGGYDDARGTQTYRDEWELLIKDAGLQWAEINTSNDMTEHTEVLPDSDWNYTRADLTKWYAAQFKGQAIPFKDAHLYVTTPMTLYSSDTSQAEALVLNPTAYPAVVTVSLMGSKGDTLVQSSSVNVAPGSMGAATINVDGQTLASQGFVRAHATMAISVPGETAKSVSSAPILIYNTVRPIMANNTKFNRVLYYSVPEYKALSGAIGLTLANDQATVNVPQGISVKFVEVLHNAIQVKNFRDQEPFVTSIPAGNKTIIGGAKIEDNDPSGCYVARVIDTEDRVGYSDPVCR